jgi:hypothetical protein
LRQEDPNPPSDVEIEKFIKAVMQAIVETVAAEDQVVAFERSATFKPGPLSPAMVRAAAFMRDRFPGGPPEGGKLAVEHADDADWIKGLGYHEMVAAAYPTSVRVAPFVLILAFYGRLNASVIADLRLREIRRPSRLGQPFVEIERGAEEETSARVELDPWKGRSGRRQHVSFPITREPDNPDVLLRFVDRWTANIRADAGAAADHVFAFISSYRTDVGVRTFAANGVDELNLKMRAICEAIPIRPITPKQLRPAAIDAIFQATGGDMALVRAAGWWRDVTTPETIYLYPRVRARGEEDLYFKDLLEERRRIHRIDVSWRPNGMDRGAATPGFMCLNPFKGPLRQEKGELCAAIGHCPVCPHSDIDETSPHTIVWLVALAEALLRKLDTMTEEKWVAQWEPMLESLLIDWIPLFAKEAVEAAKLLPAVIFEDF